jgi:hypothetical protein
MERIKREVTRLKKAGYGFVKIANTLSISVKEVRSICKEVDKVELLKGNCKQCNSKITSVKGKKIKQFCSDRCRWDYWNNKQKVERYKNDI